MTLTLEFLPCKLKIYKFNPDYNFSEIILECKNDKFFSITKTDNELSIVTSKVLNDYKEVDEGWMVFRVKGQLDFSLVGILSKISSLLAQESISIFAISTYDTDYILFKEEKLEQVKIALMRNDYHITDEK